MAVIGPVHIAKEFTIENTKIKISDDYCKDKTPDDIEKILKRIAQKSMEHFNAIIVDKCHT